MGWGQIAFGAAMNAGQTIFNNVYGEQREQHARQDNYGLNELAAWNADQRTRNLYWDLQSPAALLEQYKQAGLSPSLMFGGQGAGAQPSQGAQGSGPMGISPNVYGINALEGAQLGLINAQTRKTNAEAANEEGTGPIGDAQVKEYLTRAGLNSALKYYNETLAAGQDIKNYIQENTKEFSINEARAKADRAATLAMQTVYECISAQMQADFDESTLAERIKQVGLVNQDLTFSALLKKSNIDLNDKEMEKIDAEIDKWRNEILQGWCNVLIGYKNSETQRQFMRNINDFWDDSIDNLNKRLNLDTEKFGFEKEKFGKEMTYKWTTSVATFVAGQMNAFGEALMKIIPSLVTKGPVKVNGLP